MHLSEPVFTVTGTGHDTLERKYMRQGNRNVLHQNLGHMLIYLDRMERWVFFGSEYRSQAIQIDVPFLVYSSYGPQSGPTEILLIVSGRVFRAKFGSSYIRQQSARLSFCSTSK